MRLIAITGSAGSGKGLVSKMLVSSHPVRFAHAWHDARKWDPEGRTIETGLAPFKLPTPLDTTGIELAFADRIKEIALDLWQIPPANLWGPSELRQAPLLDWPITHVFDRTGGTGAQFGQVVFQCDCGVVKSDSRAQLPCKFLTARHACQMLGTEGGRAAHFDTWVRRTFRRAKQLASEKRIIGVQNANGNHGSFSVIPPATTVVISDLRFPSEAESVRALGGEVWFLHNERSTSAKRRTEGWQVHASESHFEEIRAQRDTLQIYNRGSVRDLLTDVRAAFNGE